MSDLTQLSTENARLTTAVNTYYKQVEAQRETIAGLLEALKVALPAVEFMASAIDADPEDEIRLHIVLSAVIEASKGQ